MSASPRFIRDNRRWPTAALRFEAQTAFFLSLPEHSLSSHNSMIIVKGCNYNGPLHRSLASDAEQKQNSKKANRVWKYGRRQQAQHSAFFFSRQWLLVSNTCSLHCFLLSDSHVFFVLLFVFEICLFHLVLLYLCLVEAKLPELLQPLSRPVSLFWQISNCELVTCFKGAGLAGLINQQEASASYGQWTGQNAFAHFLQEADLMLCHVAVRLEDWMSDAGTKMKL